MKNLSEALQWLLDAMEMWLRCAVRPVATLNDVLLEVTDEKRLSAAKKVWVPSLLIALIVSFPVLKLYGIEWSNVGYHLSIELTTIIGLVATAFIMHRALVGLELKSEFVQTLVIYTVIVATYTPVLNLIGIPSNLLTFEALRNIKQHPIAFDDAASAFFRNAAIPSSFFGAIVTVQEFLSGIVAVVVNALFAESISQWHGNDRFKCYSALAVSGLLSMIVIEVIGPIQLLIMYAFMSLGSR